jgi:acetolactate decarboxylase
VGAQRDVLRGDIGEHAAVLSSLSGLENLYALGPAEGLKGEVSVFDSEPSISRIINGKLQVYRGFNVKACFFVYAQVAAWRSVTIQSEIADDETLENYILNSASAFSINVAEPFPFLISATPVRATFHVLDKRDGLPHNPELHEKAKVRFALERERAAIIGFYSNRHRGIFTPGNANVHMHIKSADGRVSGHLEKIHFDGGATLSVPRLEGNQ